MYIVFDILHFFDHIILINKLLFSKNTNWAAKIKKKLIRFETGRQLAYT